MAVRTLCGRHGLAFSHVNGVNDVALRIKDLVRSGLGASIAAIQSHKFTSDTLIMRPKRKFMQENAIWKIFRAYG